MKVTIIARSSADAPHAVLAVFWTLTALFVLALEIHYWLVDRNAGSVVKARRLLLLKTIDEEHWVLSVGPAQNVCVHRLLRDLILCRSWLHDRYRVV